MIAMSSGGKPTRSAGVSATEDLHRRGRRCPDLGKPITQRF
jgi:hypothetical protein